MSHTFNENEQGDAQEEIVPFTEDQKRTLLVSGLLCTGFLLVFFSSFLGYAYVEIKHGFIYLLPRVDSVREASSNIRCMGALLFIAGLFERLPVTFALQKK